MEVDCSLSCSLGELTRFTSGLPSQQHCQVVQVRQELRRMLGDLTARYHVHVPSVIFFMPSFHKASWEKHTSSGPSTGAFAVATRKRDGL